MCSFTWHRLCLKLKMKCHSLFGRCSSSRSLGSTSENIAAADNDDDADADGNDA